MACPPNPAYCYYPCCQPCGASSTPPGNTMVCTNLGDMAGGNAGGGGASGKIGRKARRRKSNTSMASNSSSSSKGSTANQKMPKSKCGPKRSKSRELRAGIFYMGCDCEKWNGLQDDCMRSECQGGPQCLTRPPTCGPCQFSNGKHLTKKTEFWAKKKAAIQAKFNDELYGNVGGKNAGKDEYQQDFCEEDEDDDEDDDEFGQQYSGSGGNKNNSMYLCFPYCMGMGYPSGCCCTDGAGGDNKYGGQDRRGMNLNSSSSKETCGCDAV